GICGVPASDAHELRLRFAAFLADRSARCTGLRCVLRRHLDQRSASVSELVTEKRGERAPALIEDRAVEARLRLDVSAWSFGRALRAARHIPDLQLLDRDRAVAL